MPVEQHINAYTVARAFRGNGTSTANGRSSFPPRGLYSKPVADYSAAMSYFMAFQPRHIDMTQRMSEVVKRVINTGEEWKIGMFI